MRFLARCAGVLVLLPLAPIAGQIATVRLAVTRDIAADRADLTRVASLAESNRGVLAVAQPQDQQVKLFLPNGQVQIVGRRGEGPGEFRAPIRVGWLDDSLWVLDGTLQRITVFGPDRRVVRTIGAPTEAELLSASGRRGGARFRPTLLGVTAAGNVALSLVLPTGISADPLALADSGLGSPVVAYGGRGTSVSPLGRTARSRTIGCSVTVANRSGSFGFRLPFCNDGTDGFSPNGMWYASATPERGADPGKWWLDVEVRKHDGTKVYRVRQALSSNAVPAAELDQSREALASQSSFPAPLRESLREAEFPTHYPAISAVLVSDAGEVWLKRVIGLNDAEWLVLDARGQVARTVVFPEGVTPLAVQNGSVWGTRESPLGELSLVKFAMRAP